MRRRPHRHGRRIIANLRAAADVGTAGVRVETAGRPGITARPGAGPPWTQGSFESVFLSLAEHDCRRPLLPRLTTLRRGRRSVEHDRSDELDARYLAGRGCAHREGVERARAPSTGSLRTGTATPGPTRARRSPSDLDHRGLVDGPAFGPRGRRRDRTPIRLSAPGQEIFDQHPDARRHCATSPATRLLVGRRGAAPATQNGGDFESSAVHRRGRPRSTPLAVSRPAGWSDASKTGLPRRADPRCEQLSGPRPPTRTHGTRAPRTRWHRASGCRAPGTEHARHWGRLRDMLADDFVRLDRRRGISAPHGKRAPKTSSPRTRPGSTSASTPSQSSRSPSRRSARPRSVRIPRGRRP